MLTDNRVPELLKDFIRSDKYKFDKIQKQFNEDLTADNTDWSFYRSELKKLDTVIIILTETDEISESSVIDYMLSELVNGRIELKEKVLNSN